MRYLPKGPAERQEMLEAIGAHGIEELFRSIPEEFRLREPLRLPGPLSEAGIIEYFWAPGCINTFVRWSRMR
jgi:glycine cleavage system pyridoxal-binding protein P